MDSYPWSSELAGSAFYTLLRHNFLNLPFKAVTAIDVRSLDLFLSNSFLINSSKTNLFFEVPEFSISVLIAFLKSDMVTSKKSVLLSHLHNFLNHATLIVRLETGKNFEFFQAYFMWLYFYFSAHPTHDISQEEPANTSFSVLLSALFPRFERIAGSKEDLNLTLNVGKIRYEAFSSLGESNALQDGDLFIPSETNNPGFDLLLKAGDHLILMECKYSKADSTTRFSTTIVKDKMRSIDKLFRAPVVQGESRTIKIGSNTFKEENVIVVFISARRFIGASYIMPKDGEQNRVPHPLLGKLMAIPNVSNFKGRVLVSNLEILLGYYPPPFNSSGVFLFNYESWGAAYDKKAKATQSKTSRKSLPRP